MSAPSQELKLMPTRPVVIILVHGTILFARWPGIFRFGQWVARTFRPKLEASRRPEDVAWYKTDSLFTSWLSAALGSGPFIQEFEWSGANNQWQRLCVAGAIGDGSKGEQCGANVETLRSRIARNEADYPDCQQVLVAHSHGGNVCMAALQDEQTRNRVSGLVCLSTPFLNVRRRTDAATQAGYLQLGLWVIYFVVFFTAIIWFSKNVPAPWDTVIMTATIMVLAVIIGAILGHSKKRRDALKAWSSSEHASFNRPKTFALIADGDEALLALKIAEGLNAGIRAQWQLLSAFPRWIFPIQRKFGNNLRIAIPVYLVLCSGLLAFIVWSETEPFSTVLLLKILLIVALAPLILVLAWSLLIALPGLIVLPGSYLTLAFFRWLAFGWAGSVDVDVTAETCPIGTATITRLESPKDVRGLRHGYSYNHPDAAGVVARFIREALEEPRTATGP
jgi:hypothetical protein